MVSVPDEIWPHEARPFSIPAGSHLDEVIDNLEDEEIFAGANHLIPLPHEEETDAELAIVQEFRRNVAPASEAADGKRPAVPCLFPHGV